MPRRDWDRYLAELAELREPGIVVFAGFEQLDARGHTCMVFRHAGHYFIEGERRLDHREIAERYEAGALLSIPHLHPLRGLEAFRASPPHEMLLEIYSKWGPYESYQNVDPAFPKGEPRGASHVLAVHERGERGPFARDLLAAGRRFGFVASSDHGPPGQYGLTAVRSPDATRDALFDSLAARRTYATTGARMWMDFRVDGRPMGRIVEASPAAADGRRIEVELHTGVPIDRIEIVRNGEVWREARGVAATDLRRSYIDREPLAVVATTRPFAAGRSVEYYLRAVLQDDHVGWSSPVYFVLER